MVLTCTLRKWYPRPACGTAVSSVCISISVSLPVRARDEPGYRAARSERKRLMPKLFAKICRIIEFQDGPCLYVTAAV